MNLDKAVMKVCNCSECGDQIETLWLDGKRILGEVLRSKEGRPLCDQCAWVPVPSWSRAGPQEEDSGPWNQNAIRAMEGD